MEAVTFNLAFALKYFPFPGTQPYEYTWLHACANLFETDLTSIEKIVLKYRVNDRNSVGLSTDFMRLDRVLAIRNIAIDICVKRFPEPDETAAGRRKNFALAAGEEARQRGQWLSLFSHSGLALCERTPFALDLVPSIHRLKFFISSVIRHV